MQICWFARFLAIVPAQPTHIVTPVLKAAAKAETAALKMAEFAQHPILPYVDAEHRAAH